MVLIIRQQEYQQQDNKDNKNKGMQNETYITQAQVGPHQDNSLRKYVSMLDSKMENAKWKQNLVLSYNYMPLANIKEKLENDRITYFKKMQAQQAKLKALVDNEEIMTLLRQLSNFKQKLSQDSEKLQQKIQKQKKILKQLRSKANQRREKLKMLKRDNRKQIIVQLQQQGITTARQIKSLIRSKSTLSNSQYQPTKPSNKGSVDVSSNISILQLCIKSLEQHIRKEKKKKQQEAEQIFKHKGSLSGLNGAMKEIKQANNSFISSRIVNNYNSVPTRVTLPEQQEKQVVRVEWDDFKKLSFEGVIKLIYQRGLNFEVIKTLFGNIS